jgi:hypothetical protein
METRKQTTQKWAPSGRDIKSILESIELNRYEQNGYDWWHNKQGAVKWWCRETYKWKAQICSLTALGGTHFNVFKLSTVINKKNRTCKLNGQARKKNVIWTQYLKMWKNSNTCPIRGGPKHNRNLHVVRELEVAARCAAKCRKSA